MKSRYFVHTQKRNGHEKWLLATPTAKEKDTNFENTKESPRWQVDSNKNFITPLLLTKFLKTAIFQNTN